MGNYIYNFFCKQDKTIIIHNNNHIIPYYTPTNKTYHELEQELKKSQDIQLKRFQLNKYYCQNLNTSGIDLLT